jgi:proline-rich AKT1 substrate 1
MPFGVILKPIDVLPRALQVSINDDARVKSLFDKLQDYIARDSSETESEIRRLTMEMNQRRQRAEMDFQRIVTLIESSTCTASTKSLSSENIESLTPPVTPESINEKMMNIDEHLPQPMKTVAFAKHTNAIPLQHFTRTIDFDDDIFELDGMQDEPKNDQDRYHKYSDTDEEEGEKMTVEKRAMNRGRSGSINIARSAPISMPQFNHHLIHVMDPDDKAVNDQQMDIASSIKMLARSVHADSVFGELPSHVRHVRYNAEF